MVICLKSLNSMNKKPNKWVDCYSSLIPSGKGVLDLACGSGRHTGMLLNKGYQVTAVDIDTTSIKQNFSDKKLNIVKCDLESLSSWPFGKNSFLGIIVVNYLHRPLYSKIMESLEKGGVLIYQTFADGHSRYGKPKNPDYLLRRGELKMVFDSMRIISYQHGYLGYPSRSIVQRICCIK